MPIPPVAIAAGAVAIGGLVLLRARAVSLAQKLAGGPGDQRIVTVPPSGPPAVAVVPAGKPTAGFPVLTAAQLAAQTKENQEFLRQQALAGLMALTTTNGTIFSDRDQTGKLPDNFHVQNANEQTLDGNSFAPKDVGRPFIMVFDTDLLAKAGTPVNVVPGSGNIAVEAIEPIGRTKPGHQLAKSVDPRIPATEPLLLSMKAFTGSGDA